MREAFGVDDLRVLTKLRLTLGDNRGKDSHITLGHDDSTLVQRRSADEGVATAAPS
jgi:hypothetical protein